MDALFCLRATADAGQVLGDAGMTILIGLVVVFAVLILLTLIFMLFGKVVHRGGQAPSTEISAVPKVPAQPSTVSSTPAAPIVEDGVSDEIVAAIAAAIAAMAPEGKTYAVRRIGRARGERPVWATAGLMEHTRPF